MSFARQSWKKLLCAAALAGSGASVLFGAEATGEGGTYECWDRCTEEVNCNTSCYNSDDHSNSGPLITCGQYGVCVSAPPPPPPPACSADPCTNCFRPWVGVNADGDTVPDALEYDLANKFFPDARLQWITSDLSQAYPYQGKTIPFTVHAGPLTSLCAFDGGPNHCIEIRYGLAYRNDCGDNFNGMESNGDCDPYGGVFGINGGHKGDSEFYAALVRRVGTWTAAQNDANQWVMIRDFTAAHWRVGGDSSVLGAYSYCAPNCYAWSSNGPACTAAGGLCSWAGGRCTGWRDADQQPCVYHGEDTCDGVGGDCRWNPSACWATSMCYSTAAATSPRTLYTAEGKHALYHTDAECDDGGVGPLFLEGADECPTNAHSLRAHITGRLQNVGEWNNNGAFDHTIQHPDFCNSYDVWSGLGFANSTNYRSHFLYAFNWGLP